MSASDPPADGNDEQQVRADLAVVTAIASNTDEAVLAIDVEQRIVLFNPAAERLFGYRAADVLGHHLDVLIPPDSRRKHRELVEQFGESGATLRRASVRRDVALRHRDGTEIPAAITLLRTMSDGPALYTAIVREALSEDRAEAILDSVVTGTGGAAGTDFLDVAVRSIATALDAQTAAITVPVDDRPGWHRLLAGCSLGAPIEPFQFEADSWSDGSSPVGDIRFCSSAATATDADRDLLQRFNAAAAVVLGFADGSGRLLGHVVVADAQPIVLRRTERLSLEVFASRIADELERIESDAAAQLLREQLVRAETMQSLGRLAGGVAHDFNNVLHVLRGHALALQRSRGDPDDLDRRIAAIVRAVDRTASLVERLTAIGGTRPSHPASLPIDEFLRSLDGRLQRLVPDNITTVVDLDADDAAVIADADELQQAVINLVTNAYEAMPDGGTISISTRHAGAQTVAIDVADQGAGMATEVASQVFDPFFSTKPPATAAGLGLAKVYDTIAHAGGTIAATSTPGAGTAFTVRLPSYGARPAGSEPELPDERPPATSDIVLVVEDNAEVLEFCAEVLRDGGYRVLEALGGDECLDLLDEYDVGLVLSDITMPEMDGYQLATEIVRRHPGVPVMFMTAYADERALVPSEATVERTLRKPFSDDELLDAVASQLAARPVR